MQFSSVLLTALLALGTHAMPQNNDATSTTTATVSQVATPTISLTPQQTCLQKCNAGDVNCQAACVGVPYPNDQQMVDVTSCVAACDQGDGSPEATDRYAACSQKCITSIILSPSTPAAGGAGQSAASNTASATGASGSAASRASSATGSATSAAASATGNAANSIQKGAAVAGLAGAVMAMFAL